ncbi:alpha/beta fold hydrolase, partial [Streptomyces scabiei]|uniref:alpha/beta fold hydrolase n=1 Tax=Streptomyces scabiei TaxID=1930 RepID=UPI0039EE9651
PDDAREADELVDAYKEFAEGCGADAPKLLRHVSTVEAARDMDVLRAVLGDEKLTYVGASYGTFLGATYAGLYPDRAGRLVLDGAMDPSLPARRLNLEQTEGFETAFQSFAKDCVRQPDCPLGDKDTTPGQVGKNLKAFFDDLDATPLSAGDADGRKLTESLATTGVIAAMYDEGAWQQLRESLTSAMNEKDGAGLLVLSDSYYEREADGGYSNLMFANAAVNCLDLPAAFSSPDEVRDALPEFEKASPVFGEGLAWSSLNCAYWPVKPTGEPHRIEAAGATPIVVVGTTEHGESEGYDRTSLALGATQDALVRAVAAANPRTVAVVNSGGPVELPWREETGAVILAWVPGQEGGAGLADVLFGRAEPGGRLPTT